MNIEPTVTAQMVGDDKRLGTFARHFGRMIMQVESTVYAFADRLSADYNGGYWDYYELSNGGFYMAPHGAKQYNINCENDFSGELSADAMGIVACLYTFSHLSFNPAAPDSISQHYHYLRDFAGSHVEAALIFQAID